MSLVGPRPHAPAQDKEFAAKVPGYMRRYRVKPGITGLAQVFGYRGPTDVVGSMESRISADIEYIERKSLMLDVLIVLQTVPAVFLRRTNFATTRPATTFNNSTVIGQNQRP
jgi:lipopolysaccharide/colanic/teichoic acid biosynthesis glycosyltransferase